MNYGVKNLLEGIRVIQAEQLTKRAERLTKTTRILSDAKNAGQVARLQIISALEAELTRLKEGYGDYGTYGITRSYFSSLVERNTLPKQTAWSTRDIRQLEQDVDNFSRKLEDGELVHAELKELLEYADRHGQETVTTSWLTRSGFKPATVNRILLAAERGVEPHAE